MVLTVNDNINNMYQLQQSMLQSQKTNNMPVANKSVVQKEEETPQEYHKRKNGIALCTALGVAASLAVLSKFDKSKKYSLSLKKMFSTPLKDTYLGSVNYETKEVIGMGIGSCLGGLLGGALFDKRKNNFKEKVEEGIVQITNISLPIAFVQGLSSVGGKVTKKLQPWVKKGGMARKIMAETPKVFGSMVGLVSGMYLGNRLSHQINKHVFNKQVDDRPVKIKDFAAHIDDICLAATFVAQGNPLTQSVSRVIPLALCVAGNETGNK